MKTNFLMATVGWPALLLTAFACVAQQPGTPAGLAVPTALPAQPPRQPDKPKFNLDFGGGTPRQLVEAVENAIGTPINAIIPEEDKDVMLPGVKVRQVTVDDLFIALEQGSRRTESQITGTYYNLGDGPRHQYNMVETSCGFRRTGDIWVFINRKAVPPPDTATLKTRFYQLEPYLIKNTVDDITTAIQTAWKMMSKNNLAANRPGGSAELKFHAETKLLIAVGDTAQVQAIDDVLSALAPDLLWSKKHVDPPKTNAPNAKPATKN